MEIYYQNLLNHFNELVSIDQKAAELIKNAYLPVLLKKKEHLLRANEPSNHMRFIADGCLKVYSIDEDGNEHILQFGIKGWWVNDLYAYLTNKPSTYYIQAIQASVVLQIHREKLEELYNQLPMVERFYRMKIQSAYVALQERVMNSISRSAEQRYLDFIAQYRDLEQSIPQYLIASYLGVSPEHLSVIRRKIIDQERS